MMKKRLWTKDFVLDTMINFLIYLACYLLWVIVSSYAMNNMHASTSIAGLVSGIFIVGGVIARILTGKFVDQIGRKQVLIFGIIFYFITTLLYLVSDNIIVFIVVRFLHGIGFGISSTTAGTIVADIIPPERSGEGIGYYALSVTLATAIGPFISMMLMQYASFNVIIVLCLIVIIISGIATYLLNVPQPILTEEQISAMKQFSLNSFIEKKAVPISIVTIFVGICYSSILSFLDPFTQNENLQSAGNLFFIVYAVFILISRPVTGRMFDKKGENFILYPAFIMFALGLTFVSLANTGLLLLIGAAFIGLGYGTYTPCGQTIAVQSSPRHRMSLATSTFFGALDVGTGVGPLLLGSIIPYVGFRGIFRFTAVEVIICLILYYFLHGKKNKLNKPEKRII
ncbi:MFS transporter [Clostridium rectalis]|uniref:MFS transporter n=1 Tax=Clostridium rectalis TaxID=2040295 RepID=UPI000F64440A|nr:MFS transporter [Clostridium rectalis]